MGIRVRRIRPKGIVTKGALDRPGMRIGGPLRITKRLDWMPPRPAVPVAVDCTVCVGVCVSASGASDLLRSTGPRADLLDCTLPRHAALPSFPRAAERRLAQRCCP